MVRVQARCLSHVLLVLSSNKRIAVYGTLQTCFSGWDNPMGACVYWRFRWYFILTCTHLTRNLWRISVVCAKYSCSQDAQELRLLLPSCATLRIEHFEGHRQYLLSGVKPWGTQGRCIWARHAGYPCERQVRRVEMAVQYGQPLSKLGHISAAARRGGVPQARVRH